MFLISPRSHMVSGKLLPILGMFLLPFSVIEQLHRRIGQVSGDFDKVDGEVIRVRGEIPPCLRSGFAEPRRRQQLGR